MAHVARAFQYDDKAKFYKELRSEVEALADSYWLTYLANVSASLKQHLPDINWVGFYLVRSSGSSSELFLGPFQGLVACTRIAFNKGVCGAAATRRETILVPDVDQFPGHIVCDSASRSEIVVPLLIEDRLLGVLDIDSPALARFDEADRIGLESVVQTLVSKTKWPESF